MQIFDTKYSYADLTAFTERASDAAAKDGLQVSSIGPEPQIGLVVVTLPAPNTDVQNALASAIPEDSFVVETSEERAVAAEARDAYPPYRGGRTLYFPANQVRCSAGIAMISNSSGLVQGTTAGHCAQDGWSVKSGGAPNWPQSVGVTNLNVFLASNPAFGDVQLIGPTSQASMTRRIFEDSNTFTRIVTDKYNNSDFVPGVNLCKTGVGGGTTCGSVTAGYPQMFFSTNPSVGTERTVRNAVRISVSNGCFPGDSGGAVFHRKANNEARAAGGITAFVMVDGNRTTFCYFDPVGNIGANTNSHVWQSPL